MPLSSHNVNQHLVNNFNFFFLQPHSFSTLKSYLINKQSINVVQQQLIDEIHSIKKADKKEAQAALERSISEQQVAEDKTEKERDEREESRQDAEKIGLHSELTFKTVSLLRMQAEIAALQRVIANKAHSHTHSHPSTTTGTVNTHTHGHPSTAIQHTHNATAVTVHGHPSVVVHPDPDEIRLRELQGITLSTTLRTQMINARLAQIQNETQQRRINRSQREARLTARLDLAQHKAGVSIYDTLSASNVTVLRNRIESSNAALEAKSISLILVADRLNYSIYMQQLELSLNNLKLTAAEIEALRNAIKFMKKHFEHVNAANSIQSQLAQTNKTLAFLQSKLQQHTGRSETLLNTNPYLTQQNEALAEKNKELASSQQANQKSRDKLITPTWILASVALLTCLPLFLTMGGVIPMILAPIVLYTLVSIIPSLSLLASIGTGIAALVFAIKEKLNHHEIQANIKTIDLNKEQMGQNDLERAQLNFQTIPDCQNKIGEHTQSKMRLERSLEEAQSLAAQSLQQANTIEPLNYIPLYPILPAQGIEVAPPAYEATGGHTFFTKQVPVMGVPVEPSAPPMEAFIEPTKPSFH